MVLNYVHHIFPEGAKNWLRGGFALWLRTCHTPITYLLSTSLASCNLKMDSGVLFHTLYVIITISQYQKKRIAIVIHFNPSRSFFYIDLLLAA